MTSQPNETVEGPAYIFAEIAVDDFDEYFAAVDFVVPRAQGGKKTPHNLVAACRSCNLIKGKHPFRNLEEAKKYVLAKREERRLEWKEHMATLHGKKATA